MRPRLEKRELLELVAGTQADIPPHLTKTVVELFLQSLTEALSYGREVSLRGFGRLIPRHYVNSPGKRLGLLFHPSPRLVDRCNRFSGRS